MSTLKLEMVKSGKLQQRRKFLQRFTQNLHKFTQNLLFLFSKYKGFKRQQGVLEKKKLKLFFLDKGLETKSVILK